MNLQAEIDPLTKLAIRHGTDKWGPHFYTPIYHELFAHLRDKPVRLLEISVGGYGFRRVGGASLTMWADYFQWGTIIGLDVAEKELNLGPRVTIVQGSQADGVFLAKLAAEHGPFDIVIDDGSHVPEHVTLSFNTLFPALTAEGFYVIEDIQTAFWPQYGGLPADGGHTFKLAQSILEGLNHVEVGIAAPGCKTLPMAASIKSFRENMRELGVRGLAVYCLNHPCRHQTVISADDYADDIEVPSFRLCMKCTKCGAGTWTCARTGKNRRRSGV